MTYTFDQLKEDVRKEAEALRVHATKEERERLDIERLQPDNHAHCIYGMITGSCVSKRAAVLVDKCAIRYFDEFVDTPDDLIIYDKPEDNIEMRASESEYYLYSAIEVYIMLPNACNANLIAYLRGETDNPEL